VYKRECYLYDEMQVGETSVERWDRLSERWLKREAKTAVDKRRNQRQLVKKPFTTTFKQHSSINAHKRTPTLTDWLIDWVNVSHSTRHKTAHFSDTFHSRQLALKNKNKTQRNQSIQKAPVIMTKVHETQSTQNKNIKYKTETDEYSAIIRTSHYCKCVCVS